MATHDPGVKVALAQLGEEAMRLENEDADLARQREDVRVALNRVRLQRADLMNQHVPASRLPAEILSKIFLEGRDRSYSEWVPFATGLPSQVVVSHVNRQWRDVAINTASLWAAINVDVSKPLALLDAFLLRSRAYPLDLAISTTRPQSVRRYEKRCRRAFREIVAHVGRWSRLSVTAESRAGLQFLALLRYLYPPQLQRLSLFTSHLGDSEDEVQGMEDDSPGVSEDDDEEEEDRNQEEVDVSSLCIFRDGIPSLLFLETRVSDLAKLPSLSNVATLVLIRDRELRLGFDLSRRFFVSAPRLRSLTLRGDVFDVSRTNIPYPIEIPSLVSLRVANLRSLRPGFNHWNLFNAFSMPALHTLGFEDVQDRFMDVVSTLFNEKSALSRYPNLQCLLLDRAQINDPKYFLNGFPHLPHLTFSRMRFNGIFFKLDVVNVLEDPLCPLLKTIVLTDLPDADDNVLSFLRSMIESRNDAGVPIADLHIPSNHGCNPEDIEWLKKRVELKIMENSTMRLETSLQNRAYSPTIALNRLQRVPN